jgi:hypothetical protein
LKRLAIQAQTQVKLAVLPGTVEGESGYYQGPEDMVYRFEVLASGAWEQLGDPITMQE